MTKRKPVIIVLLCIIVSCTSPDQQKSTASLVVSADGTHLSYPDGSQFLWIGDTAWELFHRLDREESTYYLENRAEKGFSIIQAVVLAENDGLRSPNAYGELPLSDLDPSQPNEAYFEHVDFIVDKAETLGLFIGMLPTWGDKVPSSVPGAGPVVFNPDNARVFGNFLGRRYRDKPIVWILGGDRNVDSFDALEIWRAMAEGIRDGDGGRNLITYHPRGTSMSWYFMHNEEWLDFNMYQSGHEPYVPVYDYAEQCALIHPRRPFVEGEPAYEDIPVKFWEYMNHGKYPMGGVPEAVLNAEGTVADPLHFEAGFITADHVRVAAYWNFLSGACGYTYGNNAVWQMFEKGGPISIPCLYDWRESLDREGADDLRHLRKLFELRPFNLLIPDQSIVYGVNRKGKSHIRSASAIDKSFMMVYLSVGQGVHINMSKLENEAYAWWFDTREGTIIEAGTYPPEGITEFIPPTSGEGQDWILVLDDTALDLINPEISRELAAAIQHAP